MFCLGSLRVFRSLNNPAPGMFQKLGVSCEPQLRFIEIRQDTNGQRA